MYLAGVSVRRVEDITEALWDSKVSPSTIIKLNKKAYVHIEDWRNRPLRGGHYPYIYADGIYLRRNWGGEYESSWVSFFQWLRNRDLDGVKLIVGDKCMRMLEAVGEMFLEAKYQRYVVHSTEMRFQSFPSPKSNWWLRC